MNLKGMVEQIMDNLKHGWGGKNYFSLKPISILIIDNSQLY